MTALEALMWRLGEHDGRFRPTMTLVVSLGGPVERSTVVDRVSWVVDAVPRLRERVRPPALATAPPLWERDPSFDVDRHVEVATGPLWAAAEAVVAAPFEEDRPPWRVILVPPDGLVLHLHHSYTDGLGGIKLVAELFDFDPSSPAARDRVGEDGPGSGTEGVPGAPSGVGLFDELVEEMERALGACGRLLPRAVRALGEAAVRPEATLGWGEELLRALRRQAGAVLSPSSALLATRSDSVRLAHLDVALGGLRARGRELGATVNDMFLAGLLEGLARYHAKQGSPALTVRLGIPVSTRQGDGDLMHNQLAGAVLAGPLGILDLDQRARLLHEVVLQARAEPWMGLTEEAAGVVARLPGAVRVVAALAGSLEVLASNVVGPPTTMWLAGVPVTAATPVGPRSGAALNATLLSYDGRAHIGLNFDPAAVGDPDLLVDCLVAAFGEAAFGG